MIIARRTPRRLVFPAMVVALMAYAVLHSPLRSGLARVLGRPGNAAYFADGLASSALDAAAAMVLIVVALLAAAVVARRCRLEPYERPVVFGLAAFGFMAVAAAYVGELAAWTGTALLRPPLGPLIASVPALIVVGAAARRRRVPLLVEPAFAAGGLLVPLALITMVVYAVSLVAAASQPPTGFDALAFHAPMAVYFWRDGNLVSLLDRAPDGFALAHGGASELWAGLLHVIGGERLANLAQLPFAALGACALHAVSRRLGLRSRSAWLGSFGFLLAPMVVVQSGIQVTDLTAAALLMSAAALACAPGVDWTLHRVAAIAAALGLAVTTKLAVIPAAAAIVLFVAVRVAVARRGLRPVATAAVVCAVAFAIVVGPWWARNGRRYGNPIFPAALPFIEAGVVVGDFQRKDDHFVPTPGAWPLYPLLEGHSDVSGLGPLFLIGALPGLALAYRRRRGAHVLFGTIAALTLPAWWALTQHEPRHLLALSGLAFAFLPLTLLAIPRRARAAAAVTLIVGAGFSALVTIDQVFAPRLRNPPERARFYDEVWGVDAAVAGRPDRESLLYHTGFANLSYAGDYPLLGASQRRTLLNMDGAKSTDTIVSRMRAHGVSLAYVPASVEARGTVESTYDPRFFTLEQLSTVRAGSAAGTLRYLFRLRHASGEMVRVEGIR